MKFPADFVADMSARYAGVGVCVTGGAGFIGGHLVDALLSVGATISVLDDLSNSTATHITDLIELEPQRVRFVHGSVLDDDALDRAVEGCAVVMHLAAVGSVPRSVVEPQRAASVNASGTLRTLQAARRHGVRRVVVTSSSSVYGDARADAGRAPANSSALPAGGTPAPLTSGRLETEATAPISPYAASKAAAEAFTRAWGQTYALSTLTLRLFNVFGTRQLADSPYAAVIPAWCRSLAAGKAPMIFGDGQQTRDFTPVATVVSALLRAGVSPREFRGDILNISLGRATTLLELCTLVIEAYAGADADSPAARAANAGAQKSAGAAATAAAPSASARPALAPIFQPARTGDVRHSRADISRARDLLGFEPREDLRAAVAEAVAWYRAELAAPRAEPTSPDAP